MHNRTSVVTIGTIFFLFAILASSVLAQLSTNVINYQGKLSDSLGSIDGTEAMTFAVYDTNIPGIDPPLWSETHASVQVMDGIFSVSLGSQTAFPLDLFDTYDDLFLYITVAGEEMQPLQHLTATPYAMKAETADHAHTAASADSIMTGIVSGNLLIDGSVGIGTDNPESLMHLTSMGGIDLIIDADTNNSGGEDQNARIVLRQDGGEVTTRMGYRLGENDLEIMQEFDNDLIFGTNDNDRMTIKNDGKVGIGTSTPETKLHIVMPRGALMPSTVGGLVIDDNIFNSGNQLEIRDVEGNDRVVVDGAGRVGIGTAAPEAALAVRGNIMVLSESTGDLIMELGEGLDYAEGFNITEKTLEPGTVLSIDDENPGYLTLSKLAYDQKVAGIIAGGKGLGSGVRLGGKRFRHDVALAGRVFCKAETMDEDIQPGDLLTTSEMFGHAKKVKDYSRAQGAILGKAMEPMEKGRKGLILGLVTLH